MSFGPDHGRHSNIRTDYETKYIFTQLKSLDKALLNNSLEHLGHFFFFLLFSSVFFYIINVQLLEHYGY